MSLKCWIKLWGSYFLESIVGWTWMQLRLGFSVACLMKDTACLLREKVTKAIDKGTCVIYSRGPERLTKMSGNKASCYFLTVVQTCIDRNLALEIKMRLSGWWQNLLGPIVWECIYSKCVHQFAFVILLLKNIFYCRRPWSFLVLKKTFIRHFHLSPD